MPTAKIGIGNRRVEYGLVGTGQFNLPAGFNLTLSPEIDALEDGDLGGHHVQLVGVLNVGRSLSSTVTASAEVATSQNYDPAGTIRQYSLDGGLALLAATTLQFDAGANLGLNRATPGIQAYVGVSMRF